MPSGLKRFQNAESLHFITFSCFHRLPLLEARGARETVEAVLEQVRARHLARVYAYVLMPEAGGPGLIDRSQPDEGAPGPSPWGTGDIAPQGEEERCD